MNSHSKLLLLTVEWLLLFSSQLKKSYFLSYSYHSLYHRLLEWKAPKFKKLTWYVKTQAKQMKRKLKLSLLTYRINFQTFFFKLIFGATSIWTETLWFDNKIYNIIYNKNIWNVHLSRSSLNAFSILKNNVRL